MASLQIKPILHPLDGYIKVPGSKSLTNRALLIASLANGVTSLANALFSDDSYYFAKALQAVGFDIQMNETKHEIRVVGLGGKIPASAAELFIGNAGTAARFLCAFLTLGNGKYILDGDTRMRQRPINDLVNALTQLGADLETTNAHLPLRMKASGLHGGKTRIVGHVSSQFLSALLMITPYAHGPVEIEVLTELNSKPYIDMTLAVMKDFGLEIEHHGYSKFTISPAAYSPCAIYKIESDATAGSYFFAAPAICGGRVSVENISRKSVQGDIGFLNVLQRMGCTVVETNHHILVTGSTQLRGVDINMSDIPDTAQTLAVIAPFASSPTRIRGIASARAKETDRVSATCSELKRLGVPVDEHEDGMTVYPCQVFQPAAIQTYNDHRMAMAFSLIGLRVDGVTIEDAACVSKTFPDFFQVLDNLR